MTTTMTDQVRTRSIQLAEQDRLLTPAEVAAMFRVDPKTVTRWAKAGLIPAIRTPGGHRRYREVVVRQLLQAGSTNGGGA